MNFFIPLKNRIHKLFLQSKELIFPQPPEIKKIRLEISKFQKFLFTLLDSAKESNDDNNNPQNKVIQNLLDFDTLFILPMGKKPISYCERSSNSKIPKIYLYLYDRHHSFLDRTLHLLTFLTIKIEVGHGKEFYKNQNIIQELWNKYIQII